LRWYIYEPDVTYDAQQFNLKFNVSDYINDNYVGHEIYDGHDCSNGASNITGQGYVDAWVTPDSTPLGDGWGIRVMELSTKIVPENITFSNSYTHQGDNAEINFCVRFILYDNDPNVLGAIEFNHLDTKVTLYVNLLDNFAIQDINAAAQQVQGESSIDAFFVESFLCDVDDNPLPVDIDPFRQGSLVRVCVQPKQRAIDAGVRMRRIDSFIYTRNLTSQGAIVNNGAVAGNELTELWCATGSLLCSFETLLSAYFYDGAGTVTGIGTATVQFGTTSQRGLLSTRRGLEKRDSLLVTFEIPEFKVVMSKYEYSIYNPNPRSNACSTRPFFYSVIFGIGLLLF
jgi:hypothetical protein